MKCSIEGCNNRRTSRGYGKYRSVCSSHHKKKYNQTDGSRKREIKKVAEVSKEPCARCGWNESYCDRHRVKHGGEYSKENVIPLCPNCHRIEHRGRFSKN